MFDLLQTLGLLSKISISKDVEKLETFCTIGRNVK